MLEKKVLIVKHLSSFNQHTVKIAVAVPLEVVTFYS